MPTLRGTVCWSEIETVQPARRRRIRLRIHGASRRTAKAANVAITGKKLSRLDARCTAQDIKKQNERDQRQRHNQRLHSRPVRSHPSPPHLEPESIAPKRNHRL